MSHEKTDVSYAENDWAEGFARGGDSSSFRTRGVRLALASSSPMTKVVGTFELSLNRRPRGQTLTNWDHYTFPFDYPPNLSSGSNNSISVTDTSAPRS